MDDRKLFDLLWVSDNNEGHLMVAPYCSLIEIGDLVMGVESPTKTYKVVAKSSALDGSQDWNMFVLMAREEPERVSYKIEHAPMNWREGVPF